jgi:long-chain fatty acid transport protein
MSIISSLTKVLLAAGLLSIATCGIAAAGGFNRGSAATDLLYEEENFNMRFDARIVIPSQKYSVNVNPALVGTSFYDDYIVPSAGVKFNVSEHLRCAGTYTDAFGAASTFEAPKIPTGKLSEDFVISEFGATCAVRFDAGMGVISVLGGGFVEDLNYDRLTDLSVPTGGLLPPGTPATLKLDGKEYGWRAGLAYEIPDYKLRFELLYRSGTEYGAIGTLVVPGALVGSPAAAIALPAVAYGDMPQSVELNMRSGVAPDWLAFANVKWTEWSVLETLVVSTPLSTTADQYHWRDGWTVTGGVVHSFSDVFAGQVSLTWDRGVSTGWDLRGDVWTLALGGRLRAPVGGEFRIGAGFSYLESVTETQYANAIIPGDIRSGFNSAVDDGYAVTLSGGYIIQW